MASQVFCFRWLKQNLLPTPGAIYRNESPHESCRSAVEDSLTAALNDRTQTHLSEKCKIAIIEEANTSTWEDFQKNGRVNTYGHTRDKEELDTLASIPDLEWWGIWVRARHAKNRCFSDVAAVEWI
jgi:hypothetical protein